LSSPRFPAVFHLVRWRKAIYLWLALPPQHLPFSDLQAVLFPCRSRFKPRFFLSFPLAFSPNPIPAKFVRSESLLTVPLCIFDNLFLTFPPSIAFYPPQCSPSESLALPFPTSVLVYAWELRFFLIFFLYPQLRLPFFRLPCVLCLPRCPRESDRFSNIYPLPPFFLSPSLPCFAFLYSPLFPLVRTQDSGLREWFCSLQEPFRRCLTPPFKSSASAPLLGSFFRPIPQTLPCPSAHSPPLPSFLMAASAFSLGFFFYSLYPSRDSFSYSPHLFLRRN